MHVASNSLVCGFRSVEGDNFVLDKQVVRAAVKNFRKVTSSLHDGATQSLSFSGSTAYLRLLITDEKLSLTPQMWQDTHACVLLLEHRAVASVKLYSQNENDSDPNADQRLSRAVTEAFIAEQLENFIHTLNKHLSGREATALRDLLQLVRATASVSLCCH